MRHTTDKVPIGEAVFCDLCADDFTNSPIEGGVLFVSQAYCPNCTRHLDMVLNNLFPADRIYIRDRARPGETFKAFCLRLRGGDNTITLSTTIMRKTS